MPGRASIQAQEKKKHFPSTICGVPWSSNWWRRYQSRTKQDWRYFKCSKTDQCPGAQVISSITQLLSKVDLKSVQHYLYSQLTTWSKAQVGMDRWMYTSIFKGQESADSLHRDDTLWPDAADQHGCRWCFSIWNWSCHHPCAAGW